ncbi:MAG: hypothetical protein HY874_06725 [Chloroflexi bacterium]|nr:hypothetical protein [Chloroflexota bacterium]
MNRLLILPAAVAAIGAVAIVAVVMTRDGGGGNVAMAEAGAGPRAWIDHPLAGSQFQLGQSITIRWHASAADGVRQAEVRINGERLLLAEDFDHAAQIVTQRHQWTPPAAGEYVIEVTGTGADGADGAAARKRIAVVGPATPTAATPEASATAAPSASPAPAATATPRPGVTPPPLPTSTAAATATATRPPASSTPVPPTDTPVPPTSTATPISDTDPPPAPYTIYPKDGIVISPCPAASVILRWSLPSDPSGIQDFQVNLQKKNGPVWSTVLLTYVTGLAKDVADLVHCGDAYRWRVRARDGAGNWSSWSAWAEFGMTLP